MIEPIPNQDWQPNEADLAKSVRAWCSKFELKKSALLINIPQVPMAYLEKEVAQKRGYFAYHPHSLLYLAACFREQGMERKIVDLNYEMLIAVQNGETDLTGHWKNLLVKAVGQLDSPILCISFMFEATKPVFIEVCQFLRETYPKLCIWVGGVNATADPLQLLEPNLADAVFINEGEADLESFYRFLKGESSELPINMVFLDENKQLVRTPSRNGGPVDVDIREEYNLIETRNYHKAGSLSNHSRMNGLEVPFVAILAKRGCRARCAFCGVRNFNGSGVRLRDTGSVIDEMLYLRERHGIEHFDWLDDDLLMNKQSTLDLFAEMRVKLPGITWASNNGLIASAITPELYDAFRASGCIGFKVGLESGNPEMLKRIHKPTNVPQFLKFSQLSQKYLDIWVSVNFILGLPEERFEQMRDSLELAVKSKLHWYNFYIYQHLKNTEFFIAFGGLGDDYISKEHGKENSRPSEKSHSENFNNPVRQGGFKHHKGVPTGWEIFDIEPKLVPPRKWINEIWFTFNSIANFLLNPAIRTESEDLIRHMVKWFKVLGDAYPQDASMQALRYYLMERIHEPADEREQVRQRAAELFKSPYWAERDKTFHFSAFLDKDIPLLPANLAYLYDLKNEQTIPLENSDQTT